MDIYPKSLCKVAELLMSINTGFKVINWVRSYIPKTMKVSTTDSLSYIFFLRVCLGFIKNSIEISLEKFFLVIRPIFLTLVRTLFHWSSYFSTKKKIVIFPEILWIFVIFSQNIVNWEKIFTYCSSSLTKVGFTAPALSHSM